MSENEKTNSEHRDVSPSSSQTLRDNDDMSPSWFMRAYSALGNLPQFKFRGKLLSGAALNWAIALVAGSGYIMFGYDQGVFSGLLTLDDFQRVHTLMTPLEDSNPLCWTEEGPPSRDYRYCHGTPETQAAGVALYQIGCFLGAIVIFFYGERLGRKSSTFWGSLIMIIGGAMQAASFEYGLLVAGRVIGGIGNGMVTSTIPTWQSECARAEKRGFLILLGGSLITAGIMISYCKL